MPKHYRKRNKKGSTYLKRQVGKNKAFIQTLKKGIEHKFVDTVDKVMIMDSSAGASDIFTINAVINQGLLENSRIGDKINGKRIMIRGFFSNSGANAADCVCRLIIYRIKENRGATLTVNDVLSNADSVNSFYQTDSANNIDVMYDQKFAMDTTQMSLIPFKWRRRINTITNFNSTTTGLISTIEQNAYNIIVLSTITDDPGTLDAPNFNFDVRYSFTDL